jgi:hypothetical protein
MARLLWGNGWYGRRVHALPQLAVCLRDHDLQVPAALQAIADHQDERHQEWRFAQGQDRFAALYHYKGRHFAMGSVQHYRWSEWGYQETVLHLRLGDRPEAAIWINHPGETIQFGYGRPSYWGGCGTAPRAHQYRGLALLDFSTHEEQPAFTHAWFPLEAFDESRVIGSLALARSGGGAVLLRGNAPFERVTEGPSTDAEIRQYGRKTRWIIRVCEASSLDTVAAKFAALEVRQEADGTFVIEDPDYGTVRFRSDGITQAQGRSIAPEDFSVRGEATIL